VTATLGGIRERAFPLAVRHSLVRFADLRNEIVHRGATNVTDSEDIALVKTICENLLHFLLRCSDSISSEDELDVFYRMISDKKLDHEQMSKVFGIAKKMLYTPET
jgi:hypothetical protein